MGADSTRDPRCAASLARSSGRPAPIHPRGQEQPRPVRRSRCRRASPCRSRSPIGSATSAIPAAATATTPRSKPTSATTARTSRCQLQADHANASVTPRVAPIPATATKVTKSRGSANSTDAPSTTGHSSPKPRASAATRSNACASPSLRSDPSSRRRSGACTEADAPAAARKLGRQVLRGSRSASGRRRAFAPTMSCAFGRRTSGTVHLRRARRTHASRCADRPVDHLSAAHQVALRRPVRDELARVDHSHTSRDEHHSRPHVVTQLHAIYETGAYAVLPPSDSAAGRFLRPEEAGRRSPIAIPAALFT